MPPEPSAVPAPSRPPQGEGAGSARDRDDRDDLGALRRQLQGLCRRERRLLLGRGLLQAVGTLILVGVVAAALVSAGVGRDLALLLVLVGGAVLVLGALLYPLLPGWRAAGDLRRQARRVEALEPELRSRLITAVDRGLLGDDPGGGVVPLPISGPLLARAVSRARALAQPIPPSAVHSSRPVLRALALAALALAVAGLSSVILPVGPFDAALALATGKIAAARLADAVEVADQRALVGDITLRYVFPEYTGIAPVEVPNSDGTIHAPPGTVVQIAARTAEAFDAAAIQVDQAPPEDAALAGRRDIKGQLTVTGAGTWRFVLFSGERVLRSPPFAIVIEDDSAPVVATSWEDRDVAVDAPLMIPWQADDDFGLERVLLEVEQDGEVREVELRRPLDPERHLEGVIMASPRELGLSPGDKVKLRVVALDNDHMAGGKRGLSAEMETTIMGPQAAGRRMSRYYQELRDAMVLVLADFLVEDDELPIANDTAAMQRWVGGGRDRFDPVRVIYDRQWGDEEPATPDGEMTRQVLDDAAVLFRFTLTTFDPNTTRRVTMADLSTFEQLHDDEIESLEIAIGLLDALLQRDALADVAAAARDVAQEARELAAVSPDAEAAELLARLDQLERLMAKVAQAAERLSEGQLQEFLNSRLDSARSLMDEIRKAIAEGRMDDARAMLEQLAQQLEQLAEGVEDQLAAGQAEDDQLGERMQETMDALKQLEQDQDALAEQLAEARKQEGGEFQQAMDAWTRLDELAELSVAQTEGAVHASGDGSGWRVENIRRLENARQVVAGMRDAIRARDVQGAVDRVENADFRQRQAEAAVTKEATRPRLGGDTVPGGVRVAAEHIRELGQSLAEIAELLQQVQRSERQTSPELAQQARELSQRQQELKQQQQGLQRDVQAIERQMPTGQGQASDAMERAGQAMEQADDALQGGRPTPGEGHMREAADQLGAARQELERQQQQMQQMQQMQQQMRGEGQDQGDRKEGQGQLSRRRMEIPAPEQFQTPEEYRRALLEGMEAQVPEEYQALKKQYYEELVRQ